MHKPNDYLVIRAWGEMMRSAPTYIVEDQEHAAADNAPIDSICFVKKEWISVNTITNPDTRRRIEERLFELRKTLRKCP